MFRKISKILIVAILAVMLLTTGGVFATWQFADAHPTDKYLNANVQVNTFDFSGVYITEAQPSTDTQGSATVNGHAFTNLNTTVTLTSSLTSTSIIAVTVYNAEAETYAFNAIKYHDYEFSNSDFLVTVNIEHGQEILADSYLTFNVEYSYKSGATATNTVLDSIVNFEFLPLDELPEQEEIAVDGALSQFQDILSDVNNEGTFESLVEQMNSADANDRHDDSYIGNVDGASEEDKALLEELFQGNLTLNIDGEETAVTILIKREDVDGDSSTGDEQGREMAIYMTTDSLEQTGSWFRPSDAPVFVAVFTSSDLGDTWQQVGEMYSGTATIKSYNGWYGSGSFDTDSWESDDGRTIREIVSSL